jgi:hypothetical protein
MLLITNHLHYIDNELFNVYFGVKWYIVTLILFVFNLLSSALSTCDDKREGKLF